MIKELLDLSLFYKESRMKTLKKLLLSAGILFNSCAIVAMDNEEVVPNIENLYANKEESYLTMKNPMYQDTVKDDDFNKARMGNNPLSQTPLESDLTDANMDLLKSTHLNEDQLNEIKTLLLQAFNKKGVLISSDEQAAVKLLNAIQTNSDPTNSTFYGNIKKIAENCNIYKADQKKLKATFDKLYQEFQ